jgi:hypothetical protein
LKKKEIPEIPEIPGRSPQFHEIPEIPEIPGRSPQFHNSDNRRGNHSQDTQTQ